MTKVIYFCISMLAMASLSAQSFQIKDLATSVGNWEGNLTYLDYSSGKPFTMLANIKISLTTPGINNNTFQFLNYQDRITEGLTLLDGTIEKIMGHMPFAGMYIH